MSSLLEEMEDDGDIVICSNDTSTVIRKLHEAVLTVVPDTSLTTSEMYGVRSLLIEAIGNKKFFDWEMPILTGFSADEFESIARKLPKE
ncbi:hypothetical protein OA79_11825 [Marinomonas sp. TW1]|nr:hypothetical protein OA79_11825 [Marinomonas sp. TW1]